MRVLIEKRQFGRALTILLWAVLVWCVLMFLRWPLFGNLKTLAGELPKWAN
jgi:hypothetical protein